MAAAADGLRQRAEKRRNNAAHSGQTRLTVAEDEVVIGHEAVP